ncbi:MAG: NnrU family protein [Geminicoccaceae bacterium]
MHLIANGDAASLILFATIALLALMGTGLIDARYRARFAQSWRVHAGQSSNVPLAAIIGGRQRLVFAEIGWLRLALALGLYGLLLAFHGTITGTSAISAL